MGFKPGLEIKEENVNPADAMKRIPCYKILLSMAKGEIYFWPLFLVFFFFTHLALEGFNQNKEPRNVPWVCLSCGVVGQTTFGKTPTSRLQHQEIWPDHGIWPLYLVTELGIKKNIYIYSEQSGV